MTKATDMRSLLRLMAWLSPAFPVGAFAYSGGLERAVADGLLAGEHGLSDWIAAVVDHGSAWNDAVLLNEALSAHADAGRLHAVAELAEALAGSRERHAETMALGNAFVEAAGAWPADVVGLLPQTVAYPVAVGAVAGAHGIAAGQAIGAYLHAAVSQLVSAGIRLGVAGQRQGVAVVAELEPLLEAVAQRGAASTLDDLGSATIRADIASLAHEIQGTRLFRS
ncbi:urease accessory protein UreF [Rhizobium sp. CG5]|uniref:urease accessory protein UreF n=1 Tax=Rhizobium sp. CG5 TaxID=2726076 RepID=UPI0020343265|nr:urease accessory protein UreF [Rhizobium sp. CG5]MCM2473210.1 urease accessory protein UreF [Rhizobium sp. CG5]